MEDGTKVLGNIEIKGRSLIVNVNSAARAERAIAMLCAALGRLVTAPLTQIQTVEQMMAQLPPKYRPKSKPSWSMPRLTSSTALCSSSRSRCSAI